MKVKVLKLGEAAKEVEIQEIKSYKTKRKGQESNLQSLYM